VSPFRPSRRRRATVQLLVAALIATTASAATSSAAFASSVPTQPTGTTIVVPDPAGFSAERPDLPNTLIALTAKQGTSLAGLVPVASDHGRLVTRTVVADGTQAFVFDVYKNSGGRAYAAFSVVDIVTGLSTMLAHGQAQTNTDGGISGTAIGPNGSGAFRDTSAAGVAEETSSSCQVGCQVAITAATLTFIAICSVVTGFVGSVLCGLAGWVGVEGVNRACEMEGNSYDCRLLSAGIMRPDDIACDEVSCRVRIHVKNSSYAITSAGIGIYWQQKLQPREYNEWMDQFIETSPNVPLDVTDYINTFTGDPADFVMCATALDMSVSFWFDNSTHIGFFLRTSANGVPDNQIYKPINPSPGVCSVT
jgi:hypothetical protein